MMADAQEIGNFGMFAVGVDLDKSTQADWEKAAAKLKEQRDQGVVRKYYAQDYIDAVAKGDIWLSQAWSGDVFQRQLAGEPVKFVVPAGGRHDLDRQHGDPQGRRQPGRRADADGLPLQARGGRRADGLHPVRHPGDRRAGDPGRPRATRTLQALAESPLIFPTEADYAKLRSYRTLTNAEEPVFNGLFQTITQG